MDIPNDQLADQLAFRVALCRTIQARIADYEQKIAKLQNGLTEFRKEIEVGMVEVRARGYHDLGHLRSVVLGQLPPPRKADAPSS